MLATQLPEVFSKYPLWADQCKICAASLSSDDVCQMKSNLLFINYKKFIDSLEFGITPKICKIVVYE